MNNELYTSINQRTQTKVSVISPDSIASQAPPSPRRKEQLINVRAACHVVQIGLVVKNGGWEIGHDSALDVDTKAPNAQ